MTEPTLTDTLAELSDAQRWFIVGAIARSFDCGCSSCLKQFTDAIDYGMPRVGLERLTPEQREWALGCHP